MSSYLVRHGPSQDEGDVYIAVGSLGLKGNAADVRRRLSDLKTRSYLAKCVSWRAIMQGATNCADGTGHVAARAAHYSVR